MPNYENMSDAELDAMIAAQQQAAPAEEPKQESKKEAKASDKPDIPSNPNPEPDALAKAKEFGVGLFAGIMETAGNFYSKSAKMMKGDQETMSSMNVEPLQSRGLSVTNQQDVGGNIDQITNQALDQYAGTQTGYATAGRLGGNLAGLAGTPLGAAGKAMGALPKLASSASGRIAGAMGAGAAQGAMYGGAMYDRENPDAMINKTGAMAGAAAGGALGLAGRGISALATRNRPDQAMNQAVKNMIKGISTKIAKADSGKAETIAAKAVTNMAKQMRKMEKKVWKETFQDVGSTKVKVPNLANKVDDFIAANGDKLDKTQKGILADVKSKDLTFEGLKELRSQIRVNIAENFKGKALKQKITPKQAKAARDLYDDVTFALRQEADNLGRLEQFTTANTVSRKIFEFTEKGGARVADLATKTANSAKFIKKVVDPKSREITKQGLDQLGPGSTRAIGAKELKDLLTKSMTVDGVFNYGTFWKGLQTNPGIKESLNQSGLGKAIQGLNKVMENFAERGGVDLGKAAELGSVTWKASNNILKYLTSQGSKKVRRDLVKLGLIEKNQKVKEYLQSRVIDNLQKANILIARDPKGELVIDKKKQDK